MRLIMPLLFALATATITTFSDIIITVDTVASTPIFSSSPLVNTCRKLIARNNNIYHLSTESVYQNFSKGSLANQSHLLSPPGGVAVMDFTVSESETEIAFVTDAIITGQIVYQFTQAQGAKFINGGYQVLNSSIAMNSSFLYHLERLPSSFFVRTNTTHISHITSFSSTLTYADKNMVMTPDFIKVLIWTGTTIVKIHDVNTLIMLASYTPPVTPPTDSTRTISLSQDSNLALIQTDNYNPIVVLNISNNQTLHQVSFSEAIHSVHFLNSSHQFIIILGVSRTTLVNLTSGTLYDLPFLQGTEYAADRLNNLFSCYSNNISQFLVTLTYPPPPSASDSLFLVLNSSLNQTTTYKAINSSLQKTTQATTIITQVTSSIPINIYFLSFINYFTMCSLYVLLNFRMPESIFKYFAKVYQDINTNTLSMLGINLHIPRFSQEMVDSQRAIQFEVSSSIFTANMNQILFLIGNIFAIFLLQWLLSCLKQSNFLRKIVKRERKNMIFGQVINVVMPLVLPWTFIMVKAGVRDFGSKMNSVCYHIIYFFGLLFPIIYFFELLQDRQAELIKQRQKKKKDRQSIQKVPQKQIKNTRLVENNNSQKTKEHQFQQKMPQRIFKRFQNIRLRGKKQIKLDSIATKVQTQLNFVKPIRQFLPQQKFELKQSSFLTTKKEELPQRKLQLSDLLSFQIAEKWYLCQANLLLPSLVLLSEPAIFLVAILFYLVLGVVIAMNKKQMRVNSFILSLYPLLFHLCFMVFYFISLDNVLAVTEVVCLGVYLLGVIHHTLTLLFEIVLIVIKGIKFIKKKLQVKPVNKKKKKKKKKEEEKKKVKKTPLNSKSIEKKNKQQKTDGKASNQIKPSKDIKVKTERVFILKKNIKVTFFNYQKS